MNVLVKTIDDDAILSYCFSVFIYQKSLHSKSGSAEGALPALGGSDGSLALKPDLLLDLFWGIYFY